MTGDHPSPSPFVRLLQAKKAKLDGLLRSNKGPDSAEIETLVGYAASATNGVEDKPQAMSEILFMLVLMFASDKLSSESAHDKAISEHATGCLAKGRIDSIEKSVAAIASKSARQNPMLVARDLVASLPDGAPKQALTVFVAACAPLYALRGLLVVAMLSPHTVPFLLAVRDAAAAAGGG